MIPSPNTMERPTPELDDACQMPQPDSGMLLAQEAHHRIKNSLQLVASMLHLQARRHLDAPDLHETLIQASFRIHAVAKVHDRLHRSTGDVLNAGAYFQDLCADLSRSLGLPESHSVVVDVPHIALQPDRILCLGLIATELITNAVKHGVSPNGTGEVKVVLTSEPDNSLRLLVADTGPGLPPSVLRGSAGGLGIQLVRQLAQTIGGRLEIDETPLGSRLAVRFAVGPEVGCKPQASRSDEPCA